MLMRGTASFTLVVFHLKRQNSYFIHLLSCINLSKRIKEIFDLRYSWLDIILMKYNKKNGWIIVIVQSLQLISMFCLFAVVK